MMELKVQCDCGQKYKFDVEPVNNQMPFRVNCPICGADGTAKANALLQAQAPAPAIPGLAAAVAAAPMAMGVPPVPAGAPKLRIGGAAPAAAAVADAPPPPLAPIAPARPGVFPGRPGAAVAVPAVGKPKRKPNFAMGMLGGLVGALVGASIYFLVYKLTGWISLIGIVAIPVGFLAGLGARLLGGEQDGHELGYITAAFAIAGILGGEYFVAHSWWNELKNERPASAYEARVAEAKKVIAAVPNGTEQEIRAYLAKQDDDDEKPDPAAIPAEMVKDFQSSLPELRDLASGKTTKEDFDKQHAAEIAKEQEEEKSEEGTFNAVFVILLLNRVTIGSSIAAAGLAYKMSS